MMARVQVGCYNVAINKRRQQMNRSILFSVLSATALTALSAAQAVEVQFFCDDIVRIVKIPEGGKKAQTKLRRHG